MAVGRRRIAELLRRSPHQPVNGSKVTVREFSVTDASQLKCRSQLSFWRLDAETPTWDSVKRCHERCFGVLHPLDWMLVVATNKRWLVRMLASADATLVTPKKQ